VPIPARMRLMRGSSSVTALSPIPLVSTGTTPTATAFHPRRSRRPLGLLSVGDAKANVKAGASRI
jgi:hypothetical protein